MDELLDKDGNITTSCRDCYFATWDELKLTQQGCLLKRLEKYESQDLTESVETDGVLHYNIKTVCNAVRPRGWEVPEKEAIKRVNKEIAVKTDLILVSDGNNVKDNLNKSIAEVNRLVRKPDNVIFVIHNKSDYPFVEIDKDIKYKMKIPSFLVRVFEDANKEKLADLGVKHAKNLYSIIFSLGHKINSKCIYNLNYSINVKLERFVLKKSKDNFNGLIVQNILYRLVDGNNGSPVWEKIEELAKLQNNESAIKTV